jgi:indolepyruvate ferredoxin oxidoreductase beta subunit
MAQRGGAVQSHLRISDQPLHSDLVPIGGADLILAVEPLEALRYVQYLSEEGLIVANTAPFVNIPNYPPVEEVLDRVASSGPHVLVELDRLAKAAGSIRAANMVMLGAATSLMAFDAEDLNAVITEMFTRKGDKIVEINQRAFLFGQSAAASYLEGLRSGGTPRTVRRWIESTPPEQLSEKLRPDPSVLGLAGESAELSSAETQAIAQTIDAVEAQGRRRLYEHEVYSLVELVGAISAPRHVLLKPGEEITADMLQRFPGDPVVLKVVAPDVVHKTEAGAVVFVANDLDTVNREVTRLIKEQKKDGVQVEGVLIVEFVRASYTGFGNELFVGIRSSREFGPIIAAGLGGVDTEYLAVKMKPGMAVAKALAADTSAEEFFELFQATAAYDVLAGRVRGHRRIVSDGELLRCFRMFIAIARRFCVDRGEEGTGLQELEVNPFAFANQRMVPLDGRGRLGPLAKPVPARPLARVESLLQPRSIAVQGVSAKRANFGRIILKNIKESGFPVEHLYVIKDQSKPIDGVQCAPSITQVPEHVDLLVIATAAETMPEMVEEICSSGHVSSVIVIPGGLGEKEGTETTEARLRERIIQSRNLPFGGPIFLGGNCMGIVSRPGRYDTFFVPETKLDPRRDAKPRRAALISQSGAFVITRMSNLGSLDPMFAISIGNQVDLTISDMLRAVGERDDVDCIGVYVEGFRDLDGLSFVRTVESVTAAGTVVVFYKAGRTPAGRSATVGHTASVAGDYDVCDAAVGQAGAIVVDTFKEFEQLIELGTALHQKPVRGRRIAAISNAGYESVGMADAIRGQRYQIEMPQLSPETAGRLQETLAEFRLHTLVNARNPLDLTPMATDDAYEACVRVMLADDEIDAVVASFVPLTPAMLTTPEELKKSGSLADRLPQVLREADKPVIVVIDSGRIFDPLALAIRDAGVPVFRTSDQAIRSLGRYLCHRSPKLQPEQPEPAPSGGKPQPTEAATR